VGWALVLLGIAGFLTAYDHQSAVLAELAVAIGALMLLWPKG